MVFIPEPCSTLWLLSLSCTPLFSPLELICIDFVPSFLPQLPHSCLNLLPVYSGTLSIALLYISWRNFSWSFLPALYCFLSRPVAVNYFRTPLHITLGIPFISLSCWILFLESWDFFSLLTHFREIDLHSFLRKVQGGLKSLLIWKGLLSHPRTLMLNWKFDWV